MLFGLFEYLFMPFRLSNAAQTFQRMMDRTVDGLESVFAYVDDSRVGSPDRQTHLLHLEAFFNALATNGLTINLEKCVFAIPTLEIMGHRQQDRLYGWSCCSGHQATAAFSQHGKHLLQFLAKLCTGVLCPLTDLLEQAPKKWTATAQ
jgi:cytoskeleton-associated protein 5